MGFHSNALLPGFLLVLLASNFQDIKAIANQAPRPSDQSISTTHLADTQSADTTMQTFHRGSGRCPICQGSLRFKA